MEFEREREREGRKEGRKEGREGGREGEEKMTNLINLELLKPGIFQADFPFVEVLCL